MKVTSFTCATTSFASRIALISALLLGCGGDEPPCIEDVRTIDHGIYGEAKFVQHDLTTHPLRDVAITITGMREMELRTDETGLFELEVPGGYYTVCSEFLHVGCYTFGIVDNDLFRADLRVNEQLGAVWELGRVGACP